MAAIGKSILIVAAIITGTAILLHVIALAVQS